MCTDVHILTETVRYCPRPSERFVVAGSLVSTHLEILGCAETYNPDVLRVRMVIGTSFASHLDIVVKQLLLFHMIRDHCSPKRPSSTGVMADRTKEVIGKPCKTQFLV